MKKVFEGAERFNRIKPVTNILFNLIFILLTLMCIIPILLVISISLSSEASITEYGYQLIPREFSLEGYAYLVKQKGTILQALFMSVSVTVIGVILGVLLTSLMGYVLSRREYIANGFLSILVFIPMVYSGGLVASYYINTQLFKLSDTIWALILPICVSSFNVIVCRTFFSITIPDSLIESAKIDGARQMSIYFRIVLPLSLPVLATIGLFLCFSYWNDWFQAMLYINKESLLTLQAFLNRLLTDINMLAQNAQDLGLTQAQLIASMPKEAARMAIVVVIVLPIACAYPFFQKYFISGLTIGAVKG